MSRLVSCLIWIWFLHFCFALLCFRVAWSVFYCFVHVCHRLIFVIFWSLSSLSDFLVGTTSSRKSVRLFTVHPVHWFCLSPLFLCFNRTLLFVCVVCPPSPILALFNFLNFLMSIQVEHYFQLREGLKKVRGKNGIFHREVTGQGPIF